MRSVGLVTCLLTGLIVLPMLPVALPLAVLARRLGVGDRAPGGPVSLATDDRREA
jgi:hypothetical protein